MKLEIDRYIDIDGFTRSFDIDSQNGLPYKFEFLAHKEVKELEKDVLYDTLGLKLNWLKKSIADDDNKKNQEKLMKRRVDLQLSANSSTNYKSEHSKVFLESAKIINYQAYNLDDPINQRHKYTIESSYLHIDKESQYDNEFDFFQG